MASVDPTRSAAARRDELLYFLHELTRHLSKHDILERAAFFDWDREQHNPAGEWNNDTVVYALEEMIAQWAREHWDMVFERYVELGRGLCPPELHVLAEVGMLPKTPHTPGA